MTAFIDRALRFVVHNFFKTAALSFFKVFYGLKFYDVHNIPQKEGGIVMPNHASFWDPPLVGCVSYKRMFRFMARDSLFRVPGWGRLLRYMGAFPVKRGAVDRRAWKELSGIVEKGGLVTIFPEGTRSPDGNIKEGKPGAGMLVYMTKAKVIPVYIDGSHKAWPKGKKLPALFRKIRIIYGEEMDFSGYFEKKGSKEVYIEITEKIIERIKELREKLRAGGKK